ECSDNYYAVCICVFVKLLIIVCDNIPFILKVFFYHFKVVCVVFFQPDNCFFKVICVGVACVYSFLISQVLEGCCNISRKSCFTAAVEHLELYVSSLKLRGWCGSCAWL